MKDNIRNIGIIGEDKEVVITTLLEEFPPKGCWCDEQRREGFGDVRCLQCEDWKAHERYINYKKQ